jgi:ATP-dependent helicase/nuclease subunit A
MKDEGRARLTQEQQRALELRAVSVALSAGAGCGKTLVLAERFLAALEPDGEGANGAARLGQLVAITFTERAAREMRARIRHFCRQRLATSTGAVAEYWRALVRHLDQARVSTIHSFCTTLLREHAAQAGLHPRFRVLDAAQAETLLHATIGELLAERLAVCEERVVRLAAQFGLDRLPTLLTQLLERRQEIDFQTWQDLSDEALVARWHDAWRTDVRPRLLASIANSPAARTIRQIVKRETPAHPVMAARCARLGPSLDGLSASANPEAELAVIREAARVQGGGSAKAWSSPDTFAAFRDAAGELRKAIDRAAERMAFDADAARPAAATTRMLVGLGAQANAAYAARKAELAALDFDDLILHAHRLLAQGGRAIVGPLRLLLVDEFQDTDPVQAQLVEWLCGGELADGRLFLVGDTKQSIYRFRRADPQVFRRLRQALPAPGRLPLSRNFRSQPAILDFVNALFADEMPDYEPLHADRAQVAPLPAVEFLWAAGEADEPGTGASFGRKDQAVCATSAAEKGACPLPENAEDMRRREADWIARRLRALIESQTPIVYQAPTEPGASPAARPVVPGDVALLFRALSDVAYYEEALRRYGLDYYLVGGHAFYAQQEIFDLLNLLRVLARPDDAVSLAGALRSPLFNLDDETLFWLAQHRAGLAGGLFAEQTPAELDAGQTRRVRFAAETLHALRAVKDQMPVADLIQAAMERTGYDAALVAEFLGPRKLANLRKLIERARSFDQSGLLTLDDFITQLSEFVARQPEEPLAATQGETSHAVRLMTIHQAKGLEFPVVVVPDLDRLMRGRTAHVAFTPRLGPMVKCPGMVGGFELHTFLEAEEDAAELSRLLYVATTRAADYLILSGGVARPGEAKGPWTALLARRFDLLTGKLRAALPAGWPVPQVRVTRSAPSVAQTPVHAPRRSLEKIIEQAVSLAAQESGHVPPDLEPVAPDATAPRRWSFSRLSGTMHPAAAPASSADDEEPPTDRGPDPLGLGTLVHAVLADLDFQHPANLAALVDRHAAEHVDGDLRARLEAREMLERFAQSPRARSLAAARRVDRELEFLLVWPPDADGPRHGLIQGFLDCLYEDAEGRLHLIDYKTNRVEPSAVAQAAASYELQMLLYALAVEQILGRAPDELALCFLRPGHEYHFPWNAAARRRVAQQIDAATTREAASPTPPRVVSSPAASNAPKRQRRLF